MVDKLPYSARNAVGRITPVSIPAAGGLLVGPDPNRVALIIGPSDGGAFSVTTDAVAAFGIGFVVAQTGGTVELTRDRCGDLSSKAFYATSKAGTITCAVIEVYDDSGF